MKKKDKPADTVHTRRHRHLLGHLETTGRLLGLVAGSVDDALLVVQVQRAPQPLQLEDLSV